MPIELQDDNEAKVLAQAMKDGVVPPDRQEEAMAALRSYHEQTKEPEGVRDFITGRAKEAFKGVRALGDVFATVASAGVGEVMSGVAGGVTLLYGGDLDKAADVTRKTQDFLTIGPFTKEGRQVVEKVAPVLAKVEGAIDRFAEEKSMGSPAAATAIKTALLGGIELLPASKGTKQAGKLIKDLKRKENIIKAAAAKDGIELKLAEFGPDIIEAVERMTPDQRAASVPAVVEALEKAKSIELARKNAAFDKAIQTRTFIETRAVRDLSDSIDAKLRERGFDLDAENMRPVKRSIEDLKSESLGFAEGPNVAVRLNQLELARRRINKRISFDKQTNLALRAVKKEMDDFLDNEFNSIAIEAGRIPRGQGAISGDAAGVKAWKDARAANVRYHKRFTADKVIAQLIERESTPEQYRQWLTGATAMGARKEASLTIKRMKEILGDDHPVIKGIANDLFFELSEPLFRDVPSFKAFVNNYDKFVRNNPSLYDELGLSRSEMKNMRDFAAVQKDLPPSGRVFTKGDIITFITRTAVGHDIARKGVHVQFSNRLANAFFGVDVVTQKQILADLVGAKFGEPAIPKASPLAAQFIAGAAISGLEDEE